MSVLAVAICVIEVVFYDAFPLNAVQVRNIISLLHHLLVILYFHD